MGFSHISPGSLLLILIIVVVLFGTNRLRNIGKDLGEMMKSFRSGMNESQNTELVQSTDKKEEAVVKNEGHDDSKPK